MEPTWMELVLMVGLTARLTRLAVVDDIADPFRAWIVGAVDRHLGGRAGTWTVALWTCPHCIGVYVAGAVAVAWALAGHTLTYQAIAVAGTLSYVAGHAVATLDLNTSDDEE